MDNKYKIVMHFPSGNFADESLCKESDLNVAKARAKQMSKNITQATFRVVFEKSVVAEFRDGVLINAN